jgi:hypothetical protein
MNNINLRLLNKKYDEYNSYRNTLKTNIKQWLHNKKYYTFSVRIDNNEIKLNGNETLTGKDIQDFMNTYQCLLISSRKIKSNNISKQNSIYPIGEYIFYEYSFQ